MKRYKLLKELPFAKAGEIFEEVCGYDFEFSLLVLESEEDKQQRHELFIDEIENFNEWFEEVEELKTFFLINNVLSEVVEHNIKYYKDWQIENLKSVGNYFETKEEAEKYLEYLKAKAIIKQDAKGFKPNWRDKDEDRFMGCWDFKRKRALFDYGDAFKTPEIYFKSREDISESFKKHPEEWKTYLTYEQ